MKKDVWSVEHMEEVMPLIRDILSAGQSVQLYPMGTSMRPMLRQTIDSVILSPITGKLKKYDLPLYQRDNGKYVLHRIVGVGETYTCVGDNQFALEPGIRQDQLIAVVTAFYRGEKKHSVTSLSHWLYCRLWHHSRPLRQFWRRGMGWLRRKFKK